MKKKLAPIALFVYNRPSHTKKTVEALLKNNLSKESDLYVFSDGPKGEKDGLQVERVREYIDKIKGFKKITIVKQKENLGLANSIISGVSKVVSKHKKIIVLEDDLVTSKHFLEFMNESLDNYSEDRKVFGIGGYVYPIKKDFKKPFFVKLTNCWGWATWERAWNYFEEDGEKLLGEIKKRRLKRSFDIENSYPYLKMLKNQTLGKNSSWAIRWTASVFLQDGLFLYPNKSLVKNIGFDESGVHCDKDDLFKIELVTNKIKSSPISAIENKEARKYFKRFFRSIFFPRAKRKIKKIVLSSKKEDVNFSGKKLYGNDFDPKEVSEWIKNEEEAYANIKSDNTKNTSITK